MFNNLIRSISKQFDRGGTQDSQDGQNPGDRTEDGFLLVGETASERTTVRADQFQGSGIAAPPCYTSVSGGLPSYSDYSSNNNVFAPPSIDVTQHPEIAHGDPFQTGAPTVHHSSTCSMDQTENHSTGSVKTAISDIPFHFGSSLGTSVILTDIRNSNILHDRTFDLSQYEYNFETELTFLREHGHFDRDCMDIS